MPDFSHMFDSWKPSATGILLLGTVLPIVAAGLAVTILVLLLQLRQLHKNPRLAFTGILIGDCLLFVFSAGFVALTFNQKLGLAPAIFIIILVPILKFVLESALLVILRELGTPPGASDPPQTPKRAVLPLVAGIAMMVASFSVAAFGILFVSDVQAKYASTWILSIVLMLLIAAGAITCLATSLAVAVTAAGRLLRNAASRGTVALSRLAWFFPGSLILAGLVCTFLIMIEQSPAVLFDAFGQNALSSMLITLYCMIYVFPTTGVICLAAAYHKNAKDNHRLKDPLAQEGEQDSMLPERKDNQ